MANGCASVVSLLQQVKGVGTQIALIYVLTLEDPRRFRKSRDVGCFLGLRPGRRNSGQNEPQIHITKEGDRYLRTSAGGNWISQHLFPKCQNNRNVSERPPSEYNLCANCPA